MMWWACLDVIILIHTFIKYFSCGLFKQKQKVITWSIDFFTQTGSSLSSIEDDCTLIYFYRYLIYIKSTNVKEEPIYVKIKIIFIKFKICDTMVC